MNRFKELRTKNGYTQEKLADLVNVHQTAVSQWELEKSTPDVETLKKLAELYKVSIDYLLEFADDMQHINDDEALEYLDELHKRPEMKMLFQVSRKATRKDIERAIAIIEALRESSDN